MASNGHAGVVMETDQEKMKKMEVEDEEVDPWALVDPLPSGKNWSEKTFGERLKTVIVLFLKLVVLLGLLFLFVCSLDLLSDAFRLLGGKAAGEAFRQNAILSNPIADLMIGVLVTVLVQSSSTSTSIIVSMVASELLDVRAAIFMVMGANIGTSVTNTIVALGQAMDRNEFRRAFAGATVHDMFNWLSVLVLLPLEWVTGLAGRWKGCGMLCQVTGYMVRELDPKENKNAKQDLLKVITKPFTALIIRIDKKILNKIAEGEIDANNATLIKHKCDDMVPVAVMGADNSSCMLEYVEGKVRCDFMFEKISYNNWSDTAVGICLLVVALAGLCICLVLIVKLLHSLLRGRIAMIIKRVVNADFPGPFRHLTGYVAILVGAGLTMILQSSSIFTSAVTPLVGIGVLHLDRMFPLTLGANIGTTFTAILAALASSDLSKTLQVALCHLFFNIIGILIWYPVPFMRAVPLSLARALGNKTAKHRWVAGVYLATMFLLFPAGVFGLSLLSMDAVIVVVIVFVVFVISIGVINGMQDSEKCRPRLPARLQTWDCLPLAMHSLKPYDRIITCTCCKACRKHRDDDTETIRATGGVRADDVRGNGHVVTDTSLASHTNLAYDDHQPDSMMNSV